MTILKQNNKIIRNLSREILTDSPHTKILAVNPEKELTGVLVNSVTSDPSPHRFKSPSGKEPTLVGDFFDFTDSVTYLQGKGFDYSKPFIIEISYNFTYIGSHRIYSQWNYPTNNNSYIVLSATTAANDIKRIQIGFAGVIKTSKISLIEASLPIGGEWAHCLYQFDGTYLSQFTNGYLRDVSELTFTTDVYMSKGVFGSNQNYDPYQYRGLSTGLCISDIIQERFNGWDRVNDVVKYPIGVQAFVPPTVPNTLL